MERFPSPKPLISAGPAASHAATGGRAAAGRPDGRRVTDQGADSAPTTHDVDPRILDRIMQPTKQPAGAANAQDAGPSVDGLDGDAAGSLAMHEQVIADFLGGLKPEHSGDPAVHSGDPAMGEAAAEGGGEAAVEGGGDDNLEEEETPAHEAQRLPDDVMAVAMGVVDTPEYLALEHIPLAVKDTAPFLQGVLGECGSGSQQHEFLVLVDADAAFLEAAVYVTGHFNIERVRACIPERAEKGALYKLKPEDLVRVKRDPACEDEPACLEQEALLQVLADGALEVCVPSYLLDRRWIQGADGTCTGKSAIMGGADLALLIVWRRLRDPASKESLALHTLATHLGDATLVARITDFLEHTVRGTYAIRMEHPDELPSNFGVDLPCTRLLMQWITDNVDPTHNADKHQELSQLTSLLLTLVVNKYAEDAGLAKMLRLLMSPATGLAAHIKRIKAAYEGVLSASSAPVDFCAKQNVYMSDDAFAMGQRMYNRIMQLEAASASPASI